jgi:hypothetical protein
MGLLADVIHGPEKTMAAQIEEKIGEEVLAAGELRQGKELSVASMITGTAAISLLRPRGYKALPKQFILGLTPTRAVVFKGVGVGDEFGDEYGVIIRGEEQASWPRGEVSIEGEPDVRLPDGGTLIIAGERVPVIRLNVRGDRESDELIGQLSQ